MVKVTAAAVIRVCLAVAVVVMVVVVDLLPLLLLAAAAAVAAAVGAARGLPRLVCLLYTPRAGDGLTGVLSTRGCLCKEKHTH